MTTVFADTSPGPGLHALVVGVGNYRVGTGDPLELGAAVPSAIAIARWLYATYVSDAAPLRSLEVLLSPPGRSGDARTSLTLAASARRPAVSVDVEPAALGVARSTDDVAPLGVGAALRRWFDRAHASADDVALLYLCGRGAEIGGDPHFFCEHLETPTADGAPPGAVNLRQLVADMASCLARKHLLLFDCGRAAPSWDAVPEHPGSSPLVDRGDLLPPGTGPLRTACVYAVPPGCGVEGRDPTMTGFARGLLEIFRGPACCVERSTPQRAVVSTRSIVSAVDDLCDAGVLPGAVAPWMELFGRFDFHAPPTPEVPVVLETGALAAGERVRVAGGLCAALDAQRWLAWCPLGAHDAAIEARDGTAARRCQLLATPSHTRRSL